jgi:hypothetical protein
MVFSPSGEIEIANSSDISNSVQQTMGMLARIGQRQKLIRGRSLLQIFASLRTFYCGVLTSSTAAR